MNVSDWVQAATGRLLVGATKLAGGNRCESWALDLADENQRRIQVCLRRQPVRPDSVEPYTIEREGLIYKRLSESRAKIPRFIAYSQEHRSILMEMVPGSAYFRLIKDDDVKNNVLRDFMIELAKFHRLDSAVTHDLDIERGTTIAECIRNELRTWTAMYQETDRPDPLIEFALNWLRENAPEDKRAPILVHGDAGQGNFLFEGEKITAFLDWELCHFGDAMEDLAWFSMRSVMEPAPDFDRALDVYEAESGTRIDWRALLYHRVFVTARVVIIRHRAISGIPGRSIISRALNRRILVQALAEATNVPLPAIAPLEAPKTAQTELYDQVILSIKDDIVSQEPPVIISDAAKDAARTLKFLRDNERYGSTKAQADARELRALLGDRNDTEADLLHAVRDARFDFKTMLAFFAGRVAREAQLAADASGNMAHRSFPPLPSHWEKAGLGEGNPSRDTETIE